MMYGSQSAPQSVAYATQDVRMAFVRKVYGLFFASILTTVVTGFISWQPGILQFAWDNHFILWLIGFVMIMVMSWGKNRPGLNLGLLYAFSAITGFVVGPIFWVYQEMFPGVPLEAATLATTVFGGLTAYVMMTKQDFNWLGGFLFCSLLALIVGGFLMAIFHIAALSTFYSIAGVLIFSGFVLFDTSRIMTRLSTDQAAIGALELYLDFLNLVLFIMRLLGGGRRR